MADSTVEKKNGETLNIYSFLIGPWSIERLQKIPIRTCRPCSWIDTSVWQLCAAMMSWVGCLLTD